MSSPLLPSNWTLLNIRNKVRNITGTPSTDQLTDQQVNDYVNNYYIYTMPFELKVQIANQFLNFVTTPGVDVYAFPGGYFTDSPGAYADGFPMIFYQDPDVFYQDWPQQYAVDNIATGDGVTQTFTGGLQNPPVMIGTLLIVADDPTGFQQVVSDSGNIVTQNIALGNGGTAYTGTLGVFPIVPGSLVINDSFEILTDNGAGILSNPLGANGTIDYDTGIYSINFTITVPTGIEIVGSYETQSGTGTLTGDGTGTIDYLTGAYSVTWNQPPASTAYIYAKYQGYASNRPQGCLFFNNQFTLRPVPDQAYYIRMQGFVVPQQLINDNDTPLQVEWGPVIAYGAALEIFSDRGDEESMQSYLPIFKRFENVALARTVQQYTAEQSIPRF